MEGAAGVVPPPGAADSPAPGRSGHASLAVQTWLWRGKGRGGEPRRSAPIPGGRRGRGWRDNGTPSLAFAPSPGLRLSPYKRSGRKIPRGFPAAREGGPRPTPPPPDDVRQRARSPAPISAPPPAGKGARPLARAGPEAGRPLLRPGLARGCAPTDQWRPPLSSVTPPSQARARDRSILPVRAPRSPPPSRAQLPAAAAAACNLRRQDVAGG